VLIESLNGAAQIEVVQARLTRIGADLGLPRQ
jgi:hypothetical protein